LGHERKQAEGKETLSPSESSRHGNRPRTKQSQSVLDRETQVRRLL
jgi:hypothetical protein